MSYIAQTLLYLRDPIEWIDPETNAVCRGELGYVQPGAPIPLYDDDPRFEIWLAIGAVEMAPAESPTPDEQPHESPEE